jgi:hypothetical protein
MTYKTNKDSNPCGDVHSTVQPLVNHLQGLSMASLWNEAIKLTNCYSVARSNPPPSSASDAHFSRARVLPSRVHLWGEPSPSRKKTHQDQYREAAVHKCNSVVGRPKGPFPHGVGLKIRGRSPRVSESKGTVEGYWMRLNPESKWLKRVTEEEKCDTLSE